MGSSVLERNTDLEGLAEQIKNLSPANRLRLAADLIEHNQPEIASLLAADVARELVIREEARRR